MKEKRDHNWINVKSSLISLFTIFFQFFAVSPMVLVSLLLNIEVKRAHKLIKYKFGGLIINNI